MKAKSIGQIAAISTAMSVISLPAGITTWSYLAGERSEINAQKKSDPEYKVKGRKFWTPIGLSAGICAQILGLVGAHLYKSNVVEKFSAETPAYIAKVEHVKVSHFEPRTTLESTLFAITNYGIISQIANNDAIPSTYVQFRFKNTDSQINLTENIDSFIRPKLAKFNDPQFDGNGSEKLSIYDQLELISQANKALASAKYDGIRKI